MDVFMLYTELLNESNPRVLMSIKNFGDIEIELFREVAPITVANFLKLVNMNFYDGIIFHRVISGFMIQGGDPLGMGYGGSDEKIKGEFALNGVNNPLKHTRGVISMARSQMPNSASSQFFIMHQDAPHLNGSYAAFGAVVSGIEVVDKIAKVRTNYHDKPLEDVVIEKVIVK